MPLEMAARARNGDVDGAMNYGLMDCIACGSCSYVCPSNIPLVHYFNYAKGELAAQRAAKQKSDEIRLLVQNRNDRLEAEARKREEAKAARAKQKAEQVV